MASANSERRPNSASQVPASTPTTIAITMAMEHMITDPIMALSSPPRDPADGVDMVKTSRFIPPAPLSSSAQRMAVSAVRATAVATQQKPVKVTLAIPRALRLNEPIL